MPGTYDGNFYFRGAMVRGIRGPGSPSDWWTPAPMSAATHIASEPSVPTGRSFAPQTLTHDDAPQCRGNQRAAEGRGFAHNPIRGAMQPDDAKNHAGLKKKPRATSLLTPIHARSILAICSGDQDRGGDPRCMPVIDLSFILVGTTFPLDHGYPLFSAICRIVPALHRSPQIKKLQPAVS
jgi:hypothetical protein